MTEEELLLDELKRVEAMIKKNELLFDMSESEANTEALIYERKALTVRRSALIEKAKSLDIRREYFLCGK